MVEGHDGADIFADELADALRAPTPAAPTSRRAGEAASTGAPLATTRPASRGLRPHDPVPEVLRNRSFHQLFGDTTETDAGDAWGSDRNESTEGADDGAPAGATVVIRDDPRSGLLELHAGAPGPAGEASIELEGGLIISVDAAAPRRLTSIVIDRAADESGDAPPLGALVHPMLDQLLARGVPADGEWHVLALQDEQASDLDTVGRYILLTDEAGTTPVAGLASEGPAGRFLPQAALFTEALTHIPRSMRHGLGSLPAAWARRAADLLLTAEAEGGLRVPDEVAAQELANGARAASQVLSAAEGANRLEDRRVARRISALADRLTVSDPRLGAGGSSAALPASSPPTTSPLAVDAAPALRDRHPSVASQVDTGASVGVLGPGEIEIVVPLASGDDGPAASVELWARVTRRAGAVPLAVTPFVADDPAAATTVVRSRALLPVDLAVGEVVIDVTDDPGEPVPTDAAALLDSAITAGRDACRHERRGEVAAAAQAWTRCAEAWHDLGDGHRAAVAHRYASGSHPGQVVPFLADRLT